MLDFFSKIVFNNKRIALSMDPMRITYRWMTNTGDLLKRRAEEISDAACRRGMNISGQRTVF